MGYEYADCGKDNVVWHMQTTKLAGHGMDDASDIGLWTLSVQHKYNFHAGILQKGDGATVYLRDKPKVVQTALGSGDRRDVEDDNKLLLSPNALTAGPDGSVFVADFDRLLRIKPDGVPETLLKIKYVHHSYISIGTSLRVIGASAANIWLFLLN